VQPKQLLLLSVQEVFPTFPFDFDTTFFKPDHFTTDDHVFETGTRWQTIRWCGRSFGLVFRNKGTVEQPKIEIEVWGEPAAKEMYAGCLLHEMSYRYNFDLDTVSVYKTFEKFPELQLPMKNLYGMRPGQPSSLYEYVIIGIVLQNAAVRRSISMFRTLLIDYGEQVSFAGKELLCMFDPGRFANVPEEELRTKKFGYRARSIKRVDAQFATGEYDEEQLRELPVDEQKSKLLSLYGVGPATVWYLLFDICHRWEIFEHISPWEQKLYSQLFFGKDLDHLVSVGKLLAKIKKYGKYKHLAVHYLWEDLWWRHQKGEEIEWLEKEIRT